MQELKDKLENELKQYMKMAIKKLMFFKKQIKNEICESV